MGCKGTKDMKLLFENWRKHLQEGIGKTVLYHSTPPYQAEVIEANGIKVGSEGVGFMIGGNWADEVYGTRPIYLSAKPGEGGGREYEGTIFEVDATGLELYPDLPTLVDYGAYTEEDGMWWDYDEVPPEMQNVVDSDGFIEFEEFLDPDSPARGAAIHLTGTAVVLEDIPPERIRRLS